MPAASETISRAIGGEPPAAPLPFDGPSGLTSFEAAQRLRQSGRNEIQPRAENSWFVVLTRQLKSPLVLLLVFAAAVSLLVAEWVDATIVLLVVIATSGLGFAREYRAEQAVEKLKSRLQSSARVLRDRRPVSIPIAEVVPGDVVLLSAGHLVPADGLVLEASDFFVSEAALTGESFPVQKEAADPATALSTPDPTRRVFLGTNVRSGSARCLITETGGDTAFGHIARRLSAAALETSFERGLRKFSNFLSVSMILLTFLVFVANMFEGRTIVATLLFSIALAVGLSPELLPAILNINLARSTRALARHGVLVRRLNAIENLGSIDVLCTDKTGTLTEGVVHVEGSYDCAGRQNSAALELAAINATLETGLDNPLDDAIVAATHPDVSCLRKLGEIPFDSVRKRVTVLVQTPENYLVITKGAVRAILGICKVDSTGDLLNDKRQSAICDVIERWGRQGIRVIAIASRRCVERPNSMATVETEMTLNGFVTFIDRPKAGVTQTLKRLKRLGIAVKIITGDSAAVAGHIAQLVGAPAKKILTGAELRALSDEAFSSRAEQTDIFAEVDANQKEKIILALKKRGHVVGFLGDGVNDAPAMRAADTSISVHQAVDVAREAADFVLLRRDLDVLRQGVEEGRRTFANTLKYILMTTSANLGNMLSMAFSSLWLPFFPLTAGQILLNNFISDLPALGFAEDRVDPEMIEQPCHWDMKLIRRFMVLFGGLSSAFDALLFVLLLRVFEVSAAAFQTCWFIESLLSELLVALVIRTRRPFVKSAPGRFLLWSTLSLVPMALLIPLAPGAQSFGFVPIAAPLVVTILTITVAYVLSAEALKLWFFGRATTAGQSRGKTTHSIDPGNSRLKFSKLRGAKKSAGSIVSTGAELSE